MELLLIRHGLPRSEQATAARPGVDPALSDHGRAEADLLGRYLAARPEQAPAAVYTSPMRRARETAEAITACVAAPLRVDDRLREFDHGAASYVPIEHNTPETQATLWHALETGVWGAHRFDPEAFERRVLTAFTDIIDAHPSVTVAVVCHGGVINSFLGTVLQRPRGMFFRPAYTSISRVLAARSGRRELLTLNETNHLDVRDADGALTAASTSSVPRPS
jgi:probable phosphoglycerate mutase